MSFAPDLIKALDSLAASRGLPTVQAVLNKTGAAKPEKGVVLPFPREPHLWWVGRD